MTWNCLKLHVLISRSKFASAEPWYGIHVVGNAVGTKREVDKSLVGKLLLKLESTERSQERIHCCWKV